MENNTKLNLNIIKEKKIVLQKDTLIEKAIFLINNKVGGGQFELDLTITGNEKISELNDKFLHKSGPTDVISFPLQTKNDIKKYSKDNDRLILLGEIYISLDVAKNQAKEKNLTIYEEIEFLFLHGLKHLLGFHHK